MKIAIDRQMKLYIVKGAIDRPTIMKVVGSGKRGSPHLTGVKRPHGALRRDSVHDSILSCHVGDGTVVNTITTANGSSVAI